MAQNLEITRPPRRYTRADFTALRASLNRIPTARIMSLYYHEDDLVDRNCETPADLDRWLDGMRDHLVERARLANPHLSNLLGDARKLNTWSKGVIDFLVAAADQDMSQPRPDDAVSVWFKPRVSSTLRAEGLHTMSDLKRYIELRGYGWWRPIPRIGQGKARIIEQWFARHAQYMGELHLPADTPFTDLVVVTPGTEPVLAPLERMVIPPGVLDGSQGVNRNQAYCLISAQHDLEAARAYLYRYRGREKTFRAYQKELERFILWCVGVRRRPMSSVMTEDCEAYKDFLANPGHAWCGVKRPRHSNRWKPFVGPLSPASQRYAVQALRAFFDWLVKVRYLGGNPWVTVADPAVAVQVAELQLDKALPGDLWEQISQAGGILDRGCSTQTSPAQAKQYRLARAAILLMGHTGLRREEAAHATRDRLRPLPPSESPDVVLWELMVLGKRNRWRSVYLPDRAVDTLRAHWADRGHDFDCPRTELALLSPVLIPPTATSQGKHLERGSAAGRASLTGNGFSPDGLYQMVKTALLRMAADASADLTDADRRVLEQAAPHALRHTFGTQAVAGDMPTDVLQRLLGHASLQTTSIYVRAERKRSIKEVSRLYVRAART